ncbi:MAG: DUF4198 domain-containing protein [Alphaproteobacteria bacterium]
MGKLRIALTAIVVLWLAPASAHEMWIEPHAFRLAPDTEIVADMRVGQKMKGYTLPYLEASIDRIGIVDPQARRELPGTMGDLPAIHVVPEAPGLQVLFYESRAERLGWAEFAKFESFLRTDGLAWVLEEHRKRGLPDSGFQEAYTRCAKALVQVGDGVAGNDVEVGLTVELVADVNPYTLAVGDTLPVRALWRGKPFVGAQLRVFRRPPGETDAVIVDFITDDAGQGRVPLAGPGVYLLSAVQMSEGLEKPADVWHSWWASLVFEVAG